MSASKDKGRRLENQVVTLLVEKGIAAERIPLSGSLGGKYGADVVIGSVDNQKARIECKNRESLGDYLWDWLAQGGSDYLVIKKNQKKPLILMDFDHFVDLLRNQKEDS